MIGPHPSPGTSPPRKGGRVRMRPCLFPHPPVRLPCPGVLGEEQMR